MGNLRGSLLFGVYLKMKFLNKLSSVVIPREHYEFPEFFNIANKISI
jgi:hypothetical protein